MPMLPPDDRSAPRPRVRPAGVFRAVVLAALASAAPAAGCYLASDYGVPPEDDAADASDAATDDASAEDGEESIGRYSVPVYGV